MNNLINGYSEWKECAACDRCGVDGWGYEFMTKYTDDSIQLCKSCLKEMSEKSL